MTKETEDKFDRELNGVSNAMFDVDIEIKAATDEDKEVTKKIEAVYAAIDDLKAAIENYRKLKTESPLNISNSREHL